MRLIDADALIDGYKQMGYDQTEHPEESYMEGWCNGFNAAVDHCTHHVIHAPTIEERKTGEWIDSGIHSRAFDIFGVRTWASRMMCDQCGFVTHAIEGRMEQYNFCPNCGADMRGGNHETP